MGILDFFRKKKAEEAENVIELEEIGFNEVEKWLDDKREEISEKEKVVFDLIRERIDLFITGINEKKKVLENIDVESKKADDRAKVIVKQGLDKYLVFVGVFIRELTEVEKQNLSQFISDMNRIFSDFDKYSYVFYQKATFLIGDEIAAVKQEINNLSKYFTKLFNENQKIVDSFNVISSAKLKLRQLNETEKTLDEINLEIKFLDKKIKDCAEREKKILHEIEKIKASKDYAENLKMQKEIKLTENLFEEDIRKLKGLVDFKALGNVFHSDEKKMKIIKSYKEDFQENIAKDGYAGILSLIKESGLDSSVMSDKIKQIDEKKQKIAEDKKLIKKDEAKQLFGEIEKIKSEIENLSIEKVKHVQREKDVEKNKAEIMELIGASVGELGGFLIMS